MQACIYTWVPWNSIKLALSSYCAVPWQVKEETGVYNAQHIVLVEVYLNLHSTFVHLHGVYDDLQYATTSNS